MDWWDSDQITGYVWKLMPSHYTACMKSAS